MQSRTCWKQWPVVLLFLERVWIERSPHWRFWSGVLPSNWSYLASPRPDSARFGIRHVRLLCSVEATTALPTSPPVQPQLSNVAVGLVSLEYRNANFPRWARSNQWLKHAQTATTSNKNQTVKSVIVCQQHSQEETKSSTMFLWPRSLHFQPSQQSWDMLGGKIQKNSKNSIFVAPRSIVRSHSCKARLHRPGCSRSGIK